MSDDVASSDAVTLESLAARVDGLAAQVALLMRYVEQERIAVIQHLVAGEDCLGVAHEVSALAKRRQKVGKCS